MDAGRIIVVLRWSVAGLSTVGIAVPVAGATILRGSDVVFFLVAVVLSAGPVYLCAWLVRTPVMSILLAVAFIGLDVLLPIPGYRESFVTGAGAGGWFLWVDVFIGVPLVWGTAVVGCGVDVLIRYADRQASPIDPRRRV